MKVYIFLCMFRLMNFIEFNDLQNSGILSFNIVKNSKIVAF